MHDDNAILACQAHPDVPSSRRILKSEEQAASSPLVSYSSEGACALD